MKKLFTYSYHGKSIQIFLSVLLLVLLSCQTESLEIVAPYKIKLNAAAESNVPKVGQSVWVDLQLLTDSYYSETGYQLVFFQETGLGRLRQDTIPVPQKVGVPLPLGKSRWTFTPAATGDCKVVLVAMQERGYTQPDTVRLSFQVKP